MKTNSDNIVSSFFKRALFSVIFISVIGSIFIINFQQYNFYASLAHEIKINVDERLGKYNEILKLSDIKILKEDLNSLMYQLRFVTIEIYDDEKNWLFVSTSPEEKFVGKLELLKNNHEIINHNFPIYKKMNYNFFEISNNYHFIQIFYPLYKSDKLLGYMEAISYVDPIVVTRFKQGIFTTIAIVISAIFIFSLIIFPLIYFAYKKLNKHRLELLSSNIMMIHTLGGAIALRDSDTDEHNYRVTLYAIKFAQTAGLDNDDIRVLIKGAFLHDVGKIGISDNILLKNGSLNKEEFEIMRSHVMNGVELVSNNSWLEDAKDVILYHHEKYDSSGYPNGVKDKDIPMVARIFTIVDVFDALTSKRPYKEPFSYEKSIEILKDGYNKHFEGELLNSFVEISNKLYLETGLKEKEELEKELDSLIKNYFLN